MHQDPTIFVGTDYFSKDFPDQLFDHVVVWKRKDIHICPWSCSAELFAQKFDFTPERKVLLQSLARWVGACKKAEIELQSILISGSFISDKPIPSDIDICTTVSTFKVMETNKVIYEELTSRKAVQKKYNLDLTSVRQNGDFSTEILKSIAWAFYHCHPEAGRGTRGIIMLNPDDLLTIFNF